MEADERGKKLSVEQWIAYALIESGANMFIDGAGGTGKTTLLQIFDANHQGSDLWKLLRVSPNGTAAEAQTDANGSGVTYYKELMMRVVDGRVESWQDVGNTCGDSCSQVERKSRVSKRQALHTSVWADEASNTPLHQIRLHDQAERASTGVDDWYGGKQWIGTADCMQLPPPSETKHGAEGHYTNRGTSLLETDLFRSLVLSARALCFVEFTAPHRFGTNVAHANALALLRMGMRNGLLNQVLEPQVVHEDREVDLTQSVSAQVRVVGTRQQEHEHNLAPVLTAVRNLACCNGLIPETRGVDGDGVAAVDATTPTHYWQSGHEAVAQCTCGTGVDCQPHVLVCSASVQVFRQLNNQCYNCGGAHHYKRGGKVVCKARRHANVVSPQLTWVGELPTEFHSPVVVRQPNSISDAELGYVLPKWSAPRWESRGGDGGGRVRQEVTSGLGQEKLDKLAEFRDTYWKKQLHGSAPSLAVFVRGERGSVACARWCSVPQFPHVARCFGVLCRPSVQICGEQRRRVDRLARPRATLRCRRQCAGGLWERACGNCTVGLAAGRGVLGR